jgi:hypothetical protein
MIAWSEARRRWRALVALVAVVAIAGGVTLALLAGARRTATAYDRLIAASRSSHASIFMPDDEELPARHAALGRMPEVETFAAARTLFARAEGE